MAQRMFQLPGEIVNASVKTLKSAGEGKLELPLALRTGVPTSIANMKPGSSFVKCFCELRLSSDIKSHSIIAVKPGGAIETGNDGVVAYTSAHIDTAESEFIVRGPHSCQDYPSVIEEVRRILLLHLKSSPVALAPGSKGAGGQAEVSPP